MLKNRHLSKSIAAASLSEFLRQIDYKATWYGRQILECGTTHDREMNAAKNILTAGLAGCACGGNVRLPVPA